MSKILVGGSETEETNIEDESEETLAIEDINDEKKDKLYGATPYIVTYNQNLPSGYSLSGGKTWYTDSTSTDLSGSPIVLSGSAEMTCEDTSGNVRTLQGWNTYSSGAGSSYSFGASINTDAGFIGDTLTLYAMWSDPVAPTTGFMYWKVDGDDNNKTIHYYASPGEGRAAVVIGTNGVEHTSLGSSDREKIKYAVFEDNIAATNLESCFENFKGLESITNLGKLDTSNVTSMRQMFMSAGVKELDLTNFETSNVTDMYGMFSSCENLETIRVSDKFVVGQVPNNFGKFMFANCDKLEGEKGTKISDLSSPFGVAYAHIDEGSSNPGLFSGASTPPTPPTPAKTVANISVKSFNATTVATSDDFSSFSLPYMSNSESFDPNGMVITVTYDDSSTAEVTYNNTTASQFTITYNAPRVDIEYGGKSVIYNFSIVSEPNLYIYFNDNTSVKRAMRVYDSSRVSKIEDLYNYVSSGRELGFYVINATGLQDACNKYNANSTATMTLAEAMAEAQNITSVSPMTQNTFWGVTNRSKSQGGGTITPGSIYFSGGGDGGGSSSGASDPTKGPMGDLTKNLDAIRTWLNEQINTSNDIPQSSLSKDDSLASFLKSSPENINRPYTNAQDENGNRGYGQWLRVPNTTTWYFFSGDLSQLNGQSSGFLANGWYNLGWDGQEKWYYFDANGVMKIGWQVIGGKMYYLDSNLSYNWYGSRTTGTKVIDGISYSFTDKGELDTTNYNSAAGGLPPFNTPGTLPNQNEVHFYGGDLSGPDMIAPKIVIY
ncbi:MAG: BspA family leucine-rich repeat surface protein [Lachnospiraceae bacterium]|nr:BspA family leucine-rich repeat surface protein [Lachnospiraceae bacterium]